MLFEKICSGPFLNNFDWNKKKKMQVIPHSCSWFIFIIPIKLWCAKHGFSKNRNKSQALQVHRIVGETKCYNRTKQNKQYNTLHVVSKMRPIPKIFHFKIYKIFVICNKNFDHTIIIYIQNKWSFMIEWLYKFSGTFMYLYESLLFTIL